MPRTLSPPTVTFPESGGSRPARIAISVDLPEPVEPTMETNSPSSTVRCTPLKTSRTFPAEVKDFETFRTSTNDNEHSPYCLFRTPARLNAASLPRNPSSGPAEIRQHQS